VNTEIIADSEGHPSLDGKRLWMFENFYLIQEGQEELVTLSWEQPGEWKVRPVSPLAPPDKRFDDSMPLHAGIQARRMNNEPEIYSDNLTGVRLEVERDIPDHPLLKLFWTEDSENLDEINAAIQRLMVQAGVIEPPVEGK
jgi:hypothetical protein